MPAMELAGVQRVFAALEAARAEYLVVGGLAVNAHGYVRMTLDVDLVIGLEPGNVVKALRALSGAGFRPTVPVTPEEFADAANRERWRTEKNMRVLRLWSDAYPLTSLDVFTYEPFDFAREFALAVRVPLSKRLQIPVVRLETLLTMKREAGRPQDLADVAVLERMRGEDGA